MPAPADAIEANFQQAVRLHQQGQPGQAGILLKAIVESQPRHFHALHLLGMVAGQQGQPQAAVDWFNRALAVRPQSSAVYSNRGNALLDLGRYADALASCEHALTLRPDHVGALYNRGAALQFLNRTEEALASYERALAIQPDHEEALYNRGAVLHDLGRYDEALASYDRALSIRPDYPEALTNRGLTLQKGKGLLDEAIASYQQALTLRPDYAVGHNNLGNAQKDQGLIEDAIASYRQALLFKPDFYAAHSNLLFTLQYSSRQDSAHILQEARRWNARHAVPLKGLIGPHSNVQEPRRRLRIGYVSPDFRGHCQSLFTTPLLSHHDHQQFEIYCYAGVPRPDEITGRLRAHADVWRDTLGLADAQVADLIRSDRIDILVDLTMHMAQGRPLIFARKPAPVQVAWLAYPGTTGIDAIDYRLTDPYLDPPGQHDEEYSEKSIRLPDNFWCYDPLTREPAVNPLPATTAGHITFGSLNNFCKVNEGVLALWSRVLGAVPGSRLLLLSNQGRHRDRVLGAFKEHGVSPDRIGWFTPAPRRLYLEAYHRIDIGLDTFPYNGHTTSLDSFWMGVPVITLVGPTVVGRAGLCQAMNLGLPELVARSPDQYVELAVGLARDLPRLAGLRASLRQRLQASPLMDAPRFARHVEAAYRQMWLAWCQQETP